MEAFRTFLTTARTALPSAGHLKICIGNVSVDMDSVVGSLTLAYYYSLKSQEIITPVVNCKKGFFPMKLDINMHLAQHKVPELNFVEDIDFEKVSEVTLIDHNKLD